MTPSACGVIQFGEFPGGCASQGPGWAGEGLRQERGARPRPRLQMGLRSRRVPVPEEPTCSRERRTSKGVDLPGELPTRYDRHFCLLLIPSKMHV